MGVRLPGGDTTAYSWGGDINSSRANFDQSGLSQTRDVGQYSANPWGFYDMHGNVWEWCEDTAYRAYTEDPLIDPFGNSTNMALLVSPWRRLGL